MNCTRSLVVIGTLMIFFGLAEVITAFTHDFFGLHTSAGPLPTFAGAAIGAAYAAAGLLVITMKRQAAATAIYLIVFVVGGRIALVLAGFYPVDTFQQAAGMSLGTLLATSFGFYIVWNKAAFR